MFCILICEDDNHIRRLFRDTLEKEGYSVFEAADGDMALAVLETNHIDLLITDVMMPHLDGHALTRTLREGGFELPILMITARDSMDDKKTGFKAGTDDYMVKPVDMDEMLLRVFALLRRSRIANEQRLVVGQTVLDYEALSLSVGESTITLPQKEFLLLFKLLSAPNRIFTRVQIMDEIWGYESESDHRTVDVHVKRLREKLENNRDFEIITVKGLGYKSRVL
ncbi:response regulator transcription factor [Acetobacterium woodii]|uniref:Heme response regulator HssR n=1 Tax=Acetobacterium woodii (strain ATCC 29683 / DSM 1030 / JCM 2381 / KCTC 1655 / WB1) TaxID=931626 RepID=H6LGD4_ACEWD|nr:response regulator transcription factor [Acetobacterium woodii]AFA47070.1 two-component response regulator [Acetobacterium woodii DSM 1030]